MNAFATVAAVPLVSVILNTFNRRELLPLAIQSVIEQTGADWELIVVDDGSSDGTGEYLDTLEHDRMGHRVVSPP